MDIVLFALVPRRVAMGFLMFVRFIIVPHGDRGYMFLFALRVLPRPVAVGLFIVGLTSPHASRGFVYLFFLLPRKVAVTFYSLFSALQGGVGGEGGYSNLCVCGE